MLSEKDVKDILDNRRYYRFGVNGSQFILMKSNPNRSNKNDHLVEDRDIIMQVQYDKMEAQRKAFMEEEKRKYEEIQKRIEAKIEAEKRKTHKKGGKRRKKTRKKRGGWSRAKARELGQVEGDNIYYQCSNGYPPQDWRYKDGIEISNESASQGKPIAQRFKIIKMNDWENSIGPVLNVVETTTPSSNRRFDQFAETMCDDGFKPVKKNQGKIGAGRKKKTRKKRTRMRKKGGHHLYKRLGVSKYASQKQIKNSYTKLKKKNKASRKVKEAYKILSNKKTRKQYNNRYKKFIKTKKR